MSTDSPASPKLEEILNQVGPRRAKIYHMARRALDGIEQAAPWKDLYYPPTEIEDFLRLHHEMLARLEEMPYRVFEVTTGILQESLVDLLDSLPDVALDEASRRAVKNAIQNEVEVTESTRKIGLETLAAIPPQVIPATLKELGRWLIDRQCAAPDFELTGEDLDRAIEEFPDDVLDAKTKETLSNIQFYFDGIRAMTAGDIEKLQARLGTIRQSDPETVSGQDRVFTCEISADLKGKYTSAMMGAAANLIADGHFDGAVVEPALFPEKAAESERNDLLVHTLQEVLDSIRKLPEEVPLYDIVETWREGRRVDRYALTHLYGFLSSLGKLMKESSRRALYSGDYHQIQLREGRLSDRINQLNMLHNRSWEVVQEEDQTIQSLYPQMVDKAIEIAAVLDVELLKKLTGSEMVRQLLEIVSIEGENRRTVDIRLGRESEPDYRTPQSTLLREKVPLRIQSVIPLLYDEDLQTFLELLLGSVSKRASFAAKQRQLAAEAARAGAAKLEAPPEETPEPIEVNDDFTFSFLSDDEPGATSEVSPMGVTPLPPSPATAPSPAPPPALSLGAQKLEVIENLQKSLRDLLEPNSSRKAFDLVHRLLEQKGMVPLPMLQSILPFLEALTDTLVPQLVDVSAQGDLPITYQSELIQYCRDLSRRDLSPRNMKQEVLSKMEGLLRLLSDIEAVTEEIADVHRSTSSAPRTLGDLD